MVKSKSSQRWLKEHFADPFVKQAQKEGYRSRAVFKLIELDEKYRLVFVLRDIEGYSTSETAESLGISEANVKVRLLRARLMLRERLTRVFADEADRVFPDHAHE